MHESDRPRAGDEIGPYRLIDELPALEGELLLPFFRAEELATGDRVLFVPFVEDTERSLADDELAALFDRCRELSRIEIAPRREGRRTPAPFAPLVASSDGEDPGSLRFLAWRLEPGESLRSRLRRSYPDPESALEIVHGVAQQLAALHSSGEAHLGLCPANLWIGDDDRGSLLAPGLARPVASARGPLDPSALYRAPEQLPGGRGAIGPASDVFTLGLLLFELVECDRPFHAASAELLRRQIERHSPPPTTGASAALGPEFQELIDLTLDPEPARRPRSASVVVEAIDSLLTAAGVSSTSPAPAPAPAPTVTAAAGAVPRSASTSPAVGHRGPPSTPASLLSSPSPAPRIERRPVPGSPSRLGDGGGVSPWRLWILPGLILATLVALGLWLWLR